MNAPEVDPREQLDPDVPLPTVQTERSALARGFKRLLQGLALAWVSPRLLTFSIASRLLGAQRAFTAASESVARIPGTRGVFCRQAFYRFTLGSCGRDIHFGWMSTFSKPKTTVGHGAYIGRHCGVGLATIGTDAMLADGVQVLSGRRQHSLATTPGGVHRRQPQVFSRVEIGKGAWIGAGAVVMADIGANSVVGAGAVVVEAVPDSTVVAGVPARVVKRLQ